MGPITLPRQVSDLRDQVYLEDGLNPFPGEGRVVGQQKIHHVMDRTEDPGELNPRWWECYAGQVIHYSLSVPC